MSNLRVNRKVLIADDDPDMREMIRSHLEEQGWEVTLVASGNHACDRLQREKFDLLISDLRMADGTGVELLRRLRRWKKKPNQTVPPVIVITGMLDGGETFVLGLGAAAVVLKPLKLETFLTLVDETEKAARSV